MESRTNTANITENSAQDPEDQRVGILFPTNFVGANSVSKKVPREQWTNMSLKMSQRQIQK